MKVPFKGLLRTIIVFLVGIVTSSAAFAADDKYTMEDLLSLEKQGGYNEIVEHMNDIRPTQRTQKWQTLVAGAILKVLEQQATSGDPYTAVSFSEQMLDTNAFLAESQVFMDLRRKVVIDGFKVCFRGSYNAGYCTEELGKIVKKVPVDQELAFQAGKLVRLSMHASTAIPFFLQAFKGRKDDQWCADEDVLLAVTSGMNRSNEIAAGAQELGFNICFDALKPQLLRGFYAATSRYTQLNYCESLAEKKLLTKFQQAYCSDIESD